MGAASRSLGYDTPESKRGSTATVTLPAKNWESSGKKPYHGHMERASLFLAVRHGLYLAIILASLAGVHGSGRGWRLAVDGRRLVRSLAITLAAFLAFDCLGAARGWFFSDPRFSIAILPPGISFEFRVDDLDALLSALAAEGVEIDPKREEYLYGRFAWIADPDGNRIELWQPLGGGPNGASS